MHAAIFLAAGLLLGNLSAGRTLLPHSFETTLLGVADGLPSIEASPGQAGPALPTNQETAPQAEPADSLRQPESIASPAPIAQTAPPAQKSLELTVSTRPASTGSGFGAATSFAGPRRGTGGQGRGQAGHGQGGASLFGIPASGTKVVYVFDRSTSMGGGARSPLALAKAELLSSLAELGESDMFQIIFYNAQPAVFALSRQTPRMILATSRNLELARAFVGGIIADGGTAHEEALTLALRMLPDTIFFLTDADEPVLTSGQLDRISRLNRKQVVIHAVEFGRGPALGDNNFLMRLAQQNYGEYTYVDVTSEELFLQYDR